MFGFTHWVFGFHEFPKIKLFSKIPIEHYKKYNILCMLYICDLPKPYFIRTILDRSFEKT